MKIKYLFIFFLILSISCKHSDNFEQLNKKNTVFLPLISDRDIALNPLSDNSSDKVLKFLFEPLLDIDKHGEIIPNLITDWHISSDGLMWTFKIRDPLYWSNGENMTADDIIFTLNYLRKLEKSRFKMIQSIEKLDEYNFKIVLNEVYTPLLSTIQSVYPVYKDSKSEEFNPMGNGPYVLAEFVKGKYILLKKNTSAYRKGNVEYILFKYYNNNQMAFQGFLNNEVDFIDNMSVEEYLSLKKETSCRLYNYPDAGYTVMGFNFKSDLFIDKAVRQAISYSIDRNMIIKDLLHNMGEAVYGPVYPFMKKWFNKNIKKYPYNPGKARILLNEAGWKPDENGICRKNGKILYFKLTSPKGNPLRERTVILIHLYLKEIGIFADPIFMEWNNFSSNLYSGKLDCWCADYGLSCFDPHDLTYLYFFTNMIPYNDGCNYGFYSDIEIDKILFSGKKEINLNKRIDFYNKVQDKISEELPVIFLYSKNNLIALNKRIDAPNSIENFLSWKIIY